MKKSRILCLVNEAIYLLNLIFAAALALWLSSDINEAKSQTAGSTGTESIGIALGAAIAAVLLVLLLIYIAYSLIPLIFKTIEIFVPKRPLSIICSVFDAITFLAMAIMAISLITGDAEIGAVLIFSALTLLYAASFTVNIISCGAITAEQLCLDADGDTDDIDADDAEIAAESN